MPVYSGHSTEMLRAPTKTIAFTGGAGLGETATPVTVWTITGRVLLIYGTSFCTETLVSTANTGTIALGVSSSTAFLISAKTVGAGTFAANDWYDQFTAGGQAGWSDNWAEDSATQLGSHPAISQSIIITVATNPITDGTLVFDCYYMPLTAGASLT